MPVFEVIRISLARPSAPLFDGAVTLPDPVSRREFLDAAFQKPWDFLYWKKRYYYIPIGSDAALSSGIFGRELSDLKHGGPETVFELEESKEWQIAFAFLNAASDSQVIYMQRNASVGSPKKVLETFLEFVVSQDEKLAYWTPRIEYVSLKDDFWEVTREYLGRITAINFTFIPPNALRAS